MERRLAAILAADVVGYSRMIRADEEGTIANFKALLQELIDPKIAEHRGRVVKLMGDGVLVEFPSAVDAVRAAVETQEAVAERNSDLPGDKRIEFRVGINLGDVVIDGDDIHGDGVNVAARLEGLAQPGGICLSGKVYEEVRDRTDYRFEDSGEQEVKNIDRPVRVWRWPSTGGLTARATTTSETPLPLPDKPSIAVLPFDNMSGDPEQEFFSDGVTEDIITGLSRFRSLFVTARNSSFSFKNTAPNIEEVGRVLGVRYVLEGSVRRVGNRIRITAQLIDALTNSHVWAERYDRELADIFDVQDEITGKIVAAIDIEVRGAEVVRIERKPPENLDAWAHYQRGMSHLYKTSKEENIEARRSLEAAIAADPGFALAYAGLAMTCFFDVNMGFTSDVEQTLEQGLEFARKAIDLDDKEAHGHMMLGRILGMTGKGDLALGPLEKAIALNANLPFAHYNLAQMYNWLGNTAEALPHVETAIRLSPRDPLLWAFYLLKSVCLTIEGRAEEAIHAGKDAIREGPNVFWPHFALTLAYAWADRIEEAQAAAADLIRVKPDFSLSRLQDLLPNFKDESIARITEALRKASLPE